MAEQNPSAVLDVAADRVLIDEVQQAPGLFSELKVRIDAERHRRGRYVLTGSQLFPLMQGVAESLAGRVGLVHLSTLGASELRKAGHFSERYMWQGGYPEVWAVPDLDVSRFYDDYIATYLERDLRSVLAVQDLRAFDRFLRAVAVRAGQLANYEAMAADVGVSAVTLKKWLSALQASGLVSIIEPYFGNLTKRLVKTPKVFFNDHGLLCHLVGVRTAPQWRESPIQGALWENLVFGQLRRWAELSGWQRQIFFWRDRSGREVDFLIDLGDRLMLVEAKAAEEPSRDQRALEQVANELRGAAQPPRRISKSIACRVPSVSPLGDLTLWNPLLDDFQTVMGLNSK
jgi:predicted AAA+ superfamily ATPase